MYSNETSRSYVKVYPNKDAIRQMTLKSNCGETQQTVVPSDIRSENANTPRCCKAQALSQSNDSNILLMLIIAMFFCCDDSDNALFSVIAGMLFLS